ncbi:MAG TPA: GspH/FimT family pseudopilin [Gemmatimonadales bacterium]|nr:GspH/FimT family pseudopilin [Gemmatimonadales bacterium]
MPTSGRRGFTLMETLIALAVVAILSGLGYPRLRSFMLKSNVRSARSTVINTLQAAKARALMEGRSTQVNFDNSKIWTTATPRRSAVGGGTNPCDTVGTIVNLTQQYGVTVAATRSDGFTPAYFSFDLRGLGSSGSSLAVLLTRGEYKDSVNVSSYGRVSK